MEADFSIRNEVDSVKPSHQQDEYMNYVLPESPFDEFITNHMENAPPPSTFQSSNSEYWAKQAYLNSRMINDQQRLMHQQQIFNYNLMRDTLNLRQPNFWKWAAFLAVGVIIYVVFIKERNSLYRRKARHSRKNSMRPPTINEDGLQS